MRPACRMALCIKGIAMTAIDRSVMLPLVVSLDLEYNQPSRKLIQIGAAMGNVVTGEVVDRFSIFMNPHEALHPEIIALCGISQADVDAAPDLPDAYAQLVKWMEPYKNQRVLNPLTWGGGDSEDLREALNLDREDRGSWHFGRRWTDVKTIFGAWRASQGKPWDGGLARSMTKLGMVFEGRKHNALHDAENTFQVYVALLRQFQKELVLKDGRTRAFRP
jgi:inhibitor of KinA sporulation pathway (predicted exonuclease)